MDDVLTSSRLLAGRYRLIDIVGEGGMAIVYRARDELLGRDVAVKLLRPAQASDPDFVRRFRREASHAAQLHHPHVVTIHDLGIDPETGADYIVMELVDGTTLETLLAEDGPLPLGQALRIGSETAEALGAAHGRGIVHRDVKPANILIDRDGSVRVADFGIAKAAGAGGATTAGFVVGSPQYLSPEQVLGEPVTPASDVYSLGVVLFEMVTGHRPFDGPSAAAVALARIRLDPPSPAAIAPWVPAGVDEVVRRAMATDPAQRFASAADLSIALDGIPLAEVGGVRRSGSHARPPDRLEPDRSIDPAPPASVAVGADPRVGASLARSGPPEAAVQRGVHPVRAAAVRTAPRHSRPVAPARHQPDRRRAPAIAALLPLIALAVVLFGGVALLARERSGAATGSPASDGAGSSVGSNGPFVAGAPSASSTASVGPSTATSATSTPRPRPTARPVGTAQPARTPAPTPPVTTGASRSPAETVRSFYELVARHEFDAAARLWSPSMRQRYPPAQYIDGRFAATTAIDLRRVETLSQGSRTARVAVDLIEYRQSGDARHWIGSWDLVRTSSGWLMDQPRF